MLTRTGAVVERAILGGHNPANVVLMEVDPDRQKTRPDFVTTEKRWGVRAIDVRSVINEGRWLFYMRDGRKTIIHRVYNRLIPDDVERLGTGTAVRLSRRPRSGMDRIAGVVLPHQQVLTAASPASVGTEDHVSVGARHRTSSLAIRTGC